MGMSWCQLEYEIVLHRGLWRCPTWLWIAIIIYNTPVAELYMCLKHVLSSSSRLHRSQETIRKRQAALAALATTSVQCSEDDMHMYVSQKAKLLHCIMLPVPVEEFYRALARPMGVATLVSHQLIYIVISHSSMTGTTQGLTVQKSWLI